MVFQDVFFSRGGVTSKMNKFQPTNWQTSCRVLLMLIFTLFYPIFYAFKIKNYQGAKTASISLFVFQLMIFHLDVMKNLEYIK